MKPEDIPTALFGNAMRNYAKMDVALTEMMSRSPSEPCLKVETLQDKDCTVVRVTDSSSKVSVTGSAKRRRGDTFDARTGYDLALSRALRKMADKLEARYDG